MMTNGDPEGRFHTNNGFFFLLTTVFYLFFFFLFINSFILDLASRSPEGSNYNFKRAIIFPPAKRHLNGVSLAGDDGQPLNFGLVAL